MAIDFRKYMSADDLEKADRREADIKSRSTTIKGYVGGVEKELLVGHKTYADGRMVYGLMDDIYDITHRCYRFDDQFVAAVMNTTNGDFWWFDAGNTCAEIKVTRAEMRRSLKELKLI